MPSRKTNSGNPFGSGFPRAITDPKIPGAPTRGKVQKHSGAPGGAQALVGFLFIVVVNSAVLWTGARILRSAEVVSWSLSLLEVVSLAILWVVWRAIDRATHRH